MKQFSKVTLISLSIAASSVVALTVCLYTHYSTAQIDWGKTKDFFDVFESAVTIVALFAGGVWAYFNFFKGRTYHPRLELKVSGKPIFKDKESYLAVTAQLKNVGLSDVKIDQEGSALRVLLYLTEEGTIELRRIGTYSVFEDHAWIEPNELIEDQNLIKIPTDEYIAIRLELRIVSSRIDWNSIAIVDQCPVSVVTNKEKQQSILGVPQASTNEESGDHKGTRKVEREKREDVIETK